jgi:hypothetical protein
VSTSPRSSRFAFAALVALAVGTLLFAGSSAARRGTADAFVGQSYFSPPPQSIYFGTAYALSRDGNTAIVSAPGYYWQPNQKKVPQGSVYVYHQTGGGVWSGGTKLTGPTRFGDSVALSADGRVAAIGASGRNDRTGGAFVYRTSGGNVWVGQELKTKIPSREEFGKPVAISGDASAIVVGAPKDNGKKGAVWVFGRSGSTWKQLGGKLTGKDEKGAAEFGSRIALSGDGRIMLVGGPEDDSGRGAVWAFQRSGSAWKSAKLVGVGGRFGVGIALSVDGSTALIVSPGRTNDDKQAQVWTYSRSGSTWTRRDTVDKHLFPNGLYVGFAHGVSLSGDGRTAFVGVHQSLDPQLLTWTFTRAPLSFRWQAGTIQYGFCCPGVMSTDADVALQRYGETSVGIYVDAPIVRGVSPAGGPTAGGTKVILTGIDFRKVRGVNFGDARAASFTVDSETQITAVAPSGAAGQVDVRVVAVHATSPKSDSAHYTYFERPVVTAVSPTSGPSSGGTSVTITGRFFDQSSVVRFGNSVASSVHFDSATQVTAVSPPGMGVVDVTVTTLAGTSATSAADGFTYIIPPTEKVITFDDLTTVGPQQSGPTVVTSQYAGVTFNSVAAIDYSKGPDAIPGFARSGTIGIEQCVGVEFCTTPIRVTIASAQTLVRVWVGFSFRLDSPVQIQLRALNESSSVVGTATATLPANPSPTPIRTPLEVRALSPSIRSIEVSIPGGYDNALAVDHVTFS